MIAKDYDSLTRYFEALQKDVVSIDDISAAGRKEPVNLENDYIPLKLTQNPGVQLMSFSPETAVQQFQRLLLLGGPGTGKTVLLKHLARKYCKERLIIPVPVSLAEFYRSGKTLREFIDTVFEKYRFPNAGNFVETHLDAGNCLLLLDGFDEPGTAGERAATAKEIHSFAKTYHSCKIIVTCRPALYNDEFPRFIRLELVEFDENRVRQFIHNRLGGANREKTTVMLKAVMEDENLRESAKNPLMLSIIVGIYEEDRQLPQHRLRLYKRVVDVMLNRWDARKKRPNRFSPEEKIAILGKLAFHLHSRGRRSVSHSELEGVPGVVPGDPGALLEEILQRSILLEKITIDPDGENSVDSADTYFSPDIFKYKFRYTCFQDYFTALELSRQPDPITDITPHLSDPSWEEPILLYAGLTGNARSFIRLIQNEVSEDIFYTRLMLSGKCLADSGIADPVLEDKITRQLWNLYNNGEYSLLKSKAMAVLSRLKPPPIIRSLMEQLTDQAPLTRGAAAETLGLVGSSEPLLPLIMVLVKDKDVKVRGHAAEALGRSGSIRAVIPLINALHNDKAGEVRGAAAAALGSIGSTDALPALHDALTTDNNSTVRGSAADAAGKIGNPGSIAPLLQALTSERESSVRWRITRALGKLEGMVLDEVREKERERGSLRDILIDVLTSDKDGAVRESAAEALGWIGSTECISALIRALSSDENADVRGSAAYALGVSRSAEALPTLLKALVTDSDGEVRGRAAFALGRIKDIEALPYLTAVFNAHKESMIRGNAVYALGEIGGTTTVPFLIRAVSFDKDAYVRYRAAEVLGDIGTVTAIQPLQTALSDDGSYFGWKVKDKAFEALEKISKRLQVRLTNR